MEGASIGQMSIEAGQASHIGVFCQAGVQRQQLVWQARPRVPAYQIGLHHRLTGQGITATLAGLPSLRLRHRREQGGYNLVINCLPQLGEVGAWLR